MLLGLPVKGKVVDGRVSQDNAICEQFLGVDLFEDTARGQDINLNTLKNIIKI